MINPPKSLKVFALFICFTLIICAVTAKAQKPAFRFKTVVIDAGHGGKDPGARGSYSFEKNVALAIAKKVQFLLEKDMPEINVIMTRTTDKFIELKRRSEIANENEANLFISI